MLAESHPARLTAPDSGRVGLGPSTRLPSHAPSAPSRALRRSTRPGGRHPEPPPPAHPTAAASEATHPQAPPPVWAPAGKREAKHLASLLARGEPVTRMAPASFRNRKGLVILTTQRLLFMRDRWNGAMAEEFHLAAVSAVEVHQSAGSARLVIHRAGQTSEITNVAPAEAALIAQEAQRILANVHAPMDTTDSSDPTPARATGSHLVGHDPVTTARRDRRPSPYDDPAAVGRRSYAAPIETEGGGHFMAHLRELNDMRRAGLLDDYEFALAKARLLQPPPLR